MKHQFPFRTRIGKRVVTVVGQNHLGLYQTEGYGLIQGPIVPLEESPAPAAVSPQLPAVASEPMDAWTRRGFFKDKPLPRRVVKLKAVSTRNWLRSVLSVGPLPSREVYALAKANGIPARSVRRAKRHYRIKSVKRGGRWQGWGAQWMWQFPAP
jgi:hypothetical protein